MPRARLPSGAKQGARAAEQTNCTVSGGGAWLAETAVNPGVEISMRPLHPRDLRRQLPARPDGPIRFPPGSALIAEARGCIPADPRTALSRSFHLHSRREPIFW
jgi:hypothetical protein